MKSLFLSCKTPGFKFDFVELFKVDVQSIDASFCPSLPDQHHIFKFLSFS